MFEVNMAALDEWLTVKEAVKISGYQPAHIRLLIRRNEVNGMKWGRDWMVNQESLIQYLQESQTKGRKRGRKPKTQSVE
jgi:hypothetical protein